MKLFQKSFLLLIVYILFSNQLDAQSEIGRTQLSFEEALLKAYDSNQSIKQAAANLNQKKYEEKATKALYMPKISLGANYVCMSEDIHLDLTPVQDAITPLYEVLGNYGTFSGVPNPDPSTSNIMPVLPDDLSTSAVREELLHGLDEINSAEWNQVIQEQQFAMVNISVTQPLYMGGKIVLANQASKLRAEVAEIQKSETYDLVYSELVDRYFALVLCNQAVNVRQQAYDAMELHYNNAEKMKKEGLIPSAEYLHAKVYFSEAERELSKAKRQVEIVNQSLLNTLAIDSLIVIVPMSKLFYHTRLEPIEHYLQIAQQNSPLLQKIEKNIELVNKAHKLNKAEFMPNIVATGSYDIANKDLSPYIPEYFVGVGMRWSIFQGTSRSQNVKASKYQIQKAESMSKKASLDIETAITKYYQETQMYLEQLYKLENEMHFADEYFRIKNKAFNEGMATSVDVIDANLQLAKVKIEQYKAVYGYDVALSKLLYFSGQIDTFNDLQKLPDTNFLN